MEPKKKVTSVLELIKDINFECVHSNGESPEKLRKIMILKEHIMKSLRQLQKKKRFAVNI